MRPGSPMRVNLRVCEYGHHYNWSMGHSWDLCVEMALRDGQKTKLLFSQCSWHFAQTWIVDSLVME